MMGDFNSVPHTQPFFLPSKQWMSSVPADSPSPAVWPADVKDWHDKLQSMYPSAVYGLLTQGSVPTDHPEHPFSFGKTGVHTQTALSASSASSNAPLTKQQKKKLKKAGFKDPLKCGFKFVDVYAMAHGGTPPPFTTKVPEFNGCIDYCLVTADPKRVLRVLELPYTAPSSHDEQFLQVDEEAAKVPHVGRAW